MPIATDLRVKERNPAKVSQALPKKCLPKKLLPKELLPTMYDLPSEEPEEPGVPDIFHHYQPILLRETFCPPDYALDQMLVAVDLNIW